MRTWAFVSQKGGSGKSTLCTNLAVVAEAAGETCCIIDVDPQANALLWHERRGTNQPMVIDATYEKLPELIRAARTMGVTLAMIDTPGKIDAGALAAIKLADTIVCPTLGDLFSLGSIQDTVRLLEAAEKLSAAVSVINNVDESGKKQTLAEATAVPESFTLPIAPVPIMHRRAFVSAIKRGKGVMETVPKGPATREIRALWEFLNKGATPKPKGRAAKMERAAR
jgi:chromosome partitioning protein